MPSDDATTLIAYFLLKFGALWEVREGERAGEKWRARTRIPPLPEGKIPPFRAIFSLCLSSRELIDSESWRGEGERGGGGGRDEKKERRGRGRGLRGYGGTFLFFVVFLKPPRQRAPYFSYCSFACLSSLLSRLRLAPAPPFLVPRATTPTALWCYCFVFFLFEIASYDSRFDSNC